MSCEDHRTTAISLHPHPDDEFPLPLTGLAQSFAGVSCGSSAWVGILVATLLVLMLVALFVVLRIALRYQHKIALGYVFLPGDIRFDPRQVVVIPMMMMGAGFISGFLGIGAGMIVGENCTLLLNRDCCLSTVTDSHE